MGLNPGQKRIVERAKREAKEAKDRLRPVDEELAGIKTKHMLELAVLKQEHEASLEEVKRTAAQEIARSHDESREKVVLERQTATNATSVVFSKEARIAQLEIQLESAEVEIAKLKDDVRVANIAESTQSKLLKEALEKVDASDVKKLRRRLEERSSQVGTLERQLKTATAEAKLAKEKQDDAVNDANYQKRRLAAAHVELAKLKGEPVPAEEPTAPAAQPTA